MGIGRPPNKDSVNPKFEVLLSGDELIAAHEIRSTIGWAYWVRERLKEHRSGVPLNIEKLRELENEAARDEQKIKIEREFYASKILELEEKEKKEVECKAALEKANKEREERKAQQVRASKLSKEREELEKEMTEKAKQKAIDYLTQLILDCTNFRGPFARKVAAQFVCGKFERTIETLREILNETANANHYAFYPEKLNQLEIP